MASRSQCGIAESQDATDRQNAEQAAIIPDRRLGEAHGMTVKRSIVGSDVSFGSLPVLQER